MKLLLTLFCFWILVNSMAAERYGNYSDAQTSYANRLFTFIKDSNFQEIEKLYLEKEELIQLYYNINNDTTDLYKDAQIKNYSEQRELYLSEFNKFHIPSGNENSKVSKFLISQTEIKKIKYNYLVIVRRAEDFIVKYPKSKTYLINPDYFTILEMLLNVKSNGRNYTIKLYSVYFKEKWRLFFVSPTPKLTN